MITVHLVANAHIDPVWLWPWPSGLDTLIATCRSACDRLDRHPELHFCKGEAWGYWQIERIDPRLFARMQAHVRAGRWHLVGGWWIQPDCNGPSGFALARQIALGQDYFRSRFGHAPRTAFNVDTFGHAATLPTLMRAAGQDRYVMMRPQEHEMTLPARYFRWAERPGAPEVVTFRIAAAYCVRELTLDWIRHALVDLPAGLKHTMCFVGIGDHGGAIPERHIRWLLEHRDALPGCRLEFSSPDRFFDAIWPQRDQLPLVTGELQSHAMGCYTVYRPIKVAVRRAEHALAAAEAMHQHDPCPPPDAAARLTEAWQHVAFNHFHDTYGGTCVPSAYPQVLAQLGSALATADELAVTGMRRQIAALPDDPHQRIVLANAADVPFNGYVEHEAYNEYEQWQPHWRFSDADGRPLPMQRLHAEALVSEERSYFARLLFRARLAPGALGVCHVETAATPAPEYAGPRAHAHSATQLANDRGTAVRLDGAGELTLPDGLTLPLPRLDLLDDPTDTWSHGTDRFAGAVCATAAWEAPSVLYSGPLMAALQQPGRIGASLLLAEWRIYADLPLVQLLLRVDWRERHRLLKLVIAPPAPLAGSEDGVPGGALLRTPTGAERPVRDRSLLTLADGRQLGVVLPDVFGLDASPQHVRYTLLRSPLMAHHEPYVEHGLRGTVSDSGLHDFRFAFVGGPDLTGDALDRYALAWQRPPLTADVTAGMPAD